MDNKQRLSTLDLDRLAGKLLVAKPPMDDPMLIPVNDRWYVWEVAAGVYYEIHKADYEAEQNFFEAMIDGRLVKRDPRRSDG